MVLELTDCGASCQAADAGSKGGLISNGIPDHASEAGMDSVPVHQHAYGGSLQQNRSTHPHSVHSTFLIAADSHLQKVFELFLCLVFIRSVVSLCCC